MGYMDALRHRYSIVNQEYLLTFCTRDRTPVFSDFLAARAVVKAMRKVEEEGLAVIICWVVMPDHVHLLLSLRTDDGLPHIMRQLEVHASGFAGFRIPWQKGYHERTLRSAEDRQEIARYIVMNPVRAKITPSIREYPHWDAIYL